MANMAALSGVAEAEQAVHYTCDVLIGELRIGTSLSAQHLVPFASYLGGFTRDHPGCARRMDGSPAERRRVRRRGHTASRCLRRGLSLELVGAGVDIGLAHPGLPYPVLTAPDRVLRLIAVDGAPGKAALAGSAHGRRDSAARRFTDQLLRSHPGQLARAPTATI